MTTILTYSEPRWTQGSNVPGARSGYWEIDRIAEYRPGFLARLFGSRPRTTKTTYARLCTFRESGGSSFEWINAHTRREINWQHGEALGDIIQCHLREEGIAQVAEKAIRRGASA